MQLYKNMFKGTTDILKITPNTLFAVLGLGRFGSSVARTLSENGYEVLCCDLDPALVHEATSYATHAVEGDFSDEEVLDQIGISNFDVVIVASSTDFESSVITTMICKEKKVPFVLVKGSSSRHKMILTKAGADHVVLAEKEMGEKTAYSFMSSRSLNDLKTNDDYTVLEVVPQKDWVGKTVEELNLYQTEGMNILVVIRGKEVLSLVEPSLVVEANDRLIILTTNIE